MARVDREAHRQIEATIDLSAHVEATDLSLSNKAPLVYHAKRFARWPNYETEIENSVRWRP